MADLIAQGNEPQQRWRRRLPEGRPVILGRTGTWAVGWDLHISRRHVRLLFEGGRLRVSRLPEARNPVYYIGQQRDQFVLEPGERFVIGQTTFTLADQQVDLTVEPPQPAREHSFSPQYLKSVRFRHPDRRLEVLSRLPEVISGAQGDQELFVRLVSMLLAGLPRACAAALVAVEEEAAQPTAAHDAGHTGPTAQAAQVAVRLLHWDQRLLLPDRFQPSRRLIIEAVRRQQTVVHLWQTGQLERSRPESSSYFTASENFDWAFCTPVLGRSCCGWALYVAGRFSQEGSAGSEATDPTDLREDVKFSELVAAMLAALREMRLLEHRHAALSQFFSPVVLETLAQEDPEEVLAPRQTHLTVMFCDLRGFSRESERQQHDLLRLLERVSRALGVVTHQIRAQGGVVGDFHGDAAMGFWGWPLEQEDSVARACRAALAIRRELEALGDFRAGVGIASGPAVAGKIGTVDQVKVSAFGPVVNLAARLEGITRLCGASILLDQKTAELARRQLPPGLVRLRRVAVIQPYGMQRAEAVSELLPPSTQDRRLSDQQLARYETALEAFVSGDWPAADSLLESLRKHDPVAEFLARWVQRLQNTEPTGFDGVIRLEAK